MRNPLIPFLLLAVFSSIQSTIKPDDSTGTVDRQMFISLISIYLIFTPWITITVMNLLKKINRFAAFAIGIFTATIVLLVDSYFMVLGAIGYFYSGYGALAIGYCVCSISVIMAGLGVLALIVSFFIKPPMPKQAE